MSNATETPAAHQARCLRCGRKIKAGAYGRVCAAKIRQAQLDEARAAFTADQQAKADELIKDGGIVLLDSGLYEAVSSKGDATYATDGHSCSCPAGAKDRKCYHELAARVLTIASRRSLAKAA
jgi:hypothetical protein